MTESKCPPPGIYHGVPFHEYLDWEAVSNSRLKLVERSLAHYEANPRIKETDALRFGSLVHAGQLEPLDIARRYAVMPNYHKDEENRTKGGERSFSKTTTYYKQRVADFQKANGDKQIIGEAEYDEMFGLLKSLASNGDAMKALDGGGEVEVSMVWEDEVTGLLCKGRIDKLKQHEGLFSDLKTTRDALKFTKYIIDLGYHRQVAFYQHGLHALTGLSLTPWIVAIEKDAPYGCRSAPVDPELVRDGWTETRRLLDSVAEAIETGDFPSYPNPTKWVAPANYSPYGNEPVALTIGGKTVEV